LLGLQMQQPPRGETWIGSTCDLLKSKSRFYKLSFHENERQRLIKARCVVRYYFVGKEGLEWKIRQKIDNEEERETRSKRVGDREKKKKKKKKRDEQDDEKNDEKAFRCESCLTITKYQRVLNLKVERKKDDDLMFSGKIIFYWWGRETDNFVRIVRAISDRISEHEMAGRLKIIGNEGQTNGARWAIWLLRAG
ncbi:hypothetical protein V1477_020659, partial [Vespula maculifrons]